MTTTFSRPAFSAPRPALAVSGHASLPHTTALVGLAALVAFVYLPVAGFGFVNWDDPWYVEHNPLIQSWHPASLWRIASEFSCRNYAPLTTLSLLVDRTLWGEWAGGFHLTNVALHLANVALVYFLLAQVTGRRWVAWAAAALFAVHPVHVESVAWVSARKGLLSATFILAALIAWLRPVRTARTGRTGRHELAATGFLLAALLAKAIAVVLPAVMLAWDRLVRREPWPQALARQLVPGTLAAVFLLVTMSAQTSETGGLREHLALSKLEILAVDAVVLWSYAGMLLWPGDLSVVYDVPVPIAPAVVIAAAAGWLAVAWRVWRCRREYPLVAFAAASAVLFLVPVLNLAPLTTLMNDRYLYLPSIPLFALAAAGLERLGRESRSRLPGGTGLAYDVAPTSRSARHPRRAAGWGRTGPVLLVAAVVLACAMAAKAHLPVWRDGLSLWQHASEKAPQLALPHIELANALHAEGRTAEARAILKHALVHCRIDELDRRRIEDKLASWR